MDIFKKKEGCWGIRDWGFGSNGKLNPKPQRGYGMSPRQLRKKNNGFDKD